MFWGAQPHTPPCVDMAKLGVQSLGGFIHLISKRDKPQKIPDVQTHPCGCPMCPWELHPAQLGPEARGSILTGWGQVLPGWVSPVSPLSTGCRARGPPLVALRGTVWSPWAWEV